MVKVGARPEAAEVFVADETTPRGTTPTTLHFQRGVIPIKVELRAKGRPPIDVDVIPDENLRVEIVYSESAPAVVATNPQNPANPANPPVAIPPTPVSPAVSPPDNPGTPPGQVGKKKRPKTEFTYEELMADDDKPSARKSNEPKPEAPKPEAAKPEAAKPDAPKPEAPKPEAPKPDRLPDKPDAPKPEPANAFPPSGLPDKPTE
jgi:hypothetical protein